MNCRGFAESVLACHQPLHELKVARVKAQRGIHPNLHNVQQFFKRDAVYATAYRGKGCQTIVVGHEVGHMFGCRHNREIAGTSNRPIGCYEYGKLISGGYVSIMAYTTTDYTTRINYFSSPDLYAPNDQPTGTTTEDCRRAHRERKAP